jgi:xanthine dehydrogenase accessory factor
MRTHRLPADVHRAIVDFTDEGRAIALAVVLQSSGSTPRKAGTKALIDQSGSIWGTIGGGRLESDACRLAVDSLHTGEPLLMDFLFHGKDAGKDEPVCGGSMRILIDPTAGARREVYREAADKLQGRARAVLLTAVHVGKPCTTEVVLLRPEEAPGEVHPAVAAVIPGCVRNEQPAFVEYRAADDAVTHALIEPLIPQPLLVIVGGGHVGQALAEQAHLVGFAVTLIEDRAEFVAPPRFPEGVTLRSGDVAEELRRLPLDRDTYVALVSRGHLVDGRALAACVRSGAAYVGMMGSRRKIALMRKQFLDGGICTAEQFDRVHAPIGLDIGARTVPEIAASIIAQLIAARRNRTS